MTAPQHPGVKSPYDGSPFLIEVHFSPIPSTVLFRYPAQLSRCPVLAETALSRMMPRTPPRVGPQFSTRSATVAPMRNCCLVGTQEAGVPILLKELGVADAYVRSAWLALRAPYGWQAPVQAKVDVRTQTRKNGTPEAEAEAFMSNPKNSRMVVKILRRHPELVGDTLEGGVLRGVDESVMRRKFNEVSAQIAVLSAVTMRASGTTAYTEEIYPIVRSIAESLSDCRLLCAPQIALTAVREHCPVPAGDCTPTVTRLVPRSDARGVQVPGRTVAPRAVLGQLQRLPAEMRPGGAGKKKVGDRKHYSKGQRDRARQAIEWVRQPAALGGGDGKLPRKDSLRFDGLKLRIVSHIFIEWRRVQKFLQRAGGVKFEVRARQLAQQGQLAEGSSSGEDDREDVDSNGSKSTSDGEMDDQEDGDEDEGETGPGSGTRSDPGAGPEVAVARRGVGLLPPTGSIDHASNQPVGASLPVPQAPALVSPATLQLNSVTRHPALQLESLLPGTGPQGAGGAEGAAGMSAGGGVDARAFTGKSNDEGGCLDRALVGVQGRGEQGIDETESANIPQIGRRN